MGGKTGIHEGSNRDPLFSLGGTRGHPRRIRLILCKEGNNREVTDMQPPDQIIISQLVVSSRIGATEEERRHPQELRVSLVMEPVGGFSNLGDLLENTVDYHAVAQVVKALAARGERLLIETLAEEIARHLLDNYQLGAVEVELRKYVLPDAKHVAVKLRRESNPFHNTHV